MVVLYRIRVCSLVSWYFEPFQPQKITSRLKTMFNQSPIYSTRKSSNHNLSKNHKISPDTNFHKQIIHKHQTQNFRRISPFGITPVKRAHKARTGWYRGPFRRFINTRCKKKSIEKEWTEAKKKKLYKSITANTSVILQLVAQTTDQLASSSC